MVIKIWELRTEKGITLSKLSAMTGISVGALSNYENSKREPTITQLEKIAKALNTTISNLYESDYK